MTTDELSTDWLPTGDARQLTPLSPFLGHDCVLKKCCKKYKKGKRCKKCPD